MRDDRLSARGDGVAESTLGLRASADLVASTSRNLVLVALGYRGLATLVAVAGIVGASTLDGAHLGALLLVTGAVLVAHAALLLLGRLRQWLPPAQRWVAAGDIAVAIGLNLWASHVVSPGSLFYDYGNPFSGYAVATLALWTGVKGRRFGLWLLAIMAVPLQLLMAWINETPVRSVVPSRFVMRGLWFVVAFAVTELLMSALRRGATELGAESDRAGRQEKREADLRDLHNGVLQALLGVEANCVNARGNGVEVEVLRRIGDESEAWSARIRALLAAEGEGWTSLGVAMRAVVDEANETGATLVDLFVSGPEPTLDARSGRALVGAAGEAIQNAQRHAHADLVRVTVVIDDQEVRVIIADDGDGFIEAEAELSPEGFGIRNSIRAAMRDIGGHARVSSDFGQGSSWELVAPVQRCPATGVLVERTLLDLAIVTIWYRVLGLSIAAAGLVSSRSFGPITLLPLLVVMAVVAFSQLVLIGVLRTHTSRPTGGWFVAADLAVTGVLNLWAAAAVPAGTVFLDYRDPFALYAQGTLALWGAVKRWPLGALLLVMMALPLQVAMALLDGIPFAALDWAKLASRAMWLVPALLLGRVVMSVARKGAVVLADENHAGGRAAERAGLLREVHLSVMAGLDAIASRTRTGVDPASDLADIGVLARREITAIRAALRRGKLSPGSRWPGLEHLIAEIESDGKVRVDLVCRGAEPTPALPQTLSLLSAVRRILDRAAATGPCHATVYAEAGQSGVRVVVRHDGCPVSGRLRPTLIDDRVMMDVSPTLDGQERCQLTVAPFSGPS